MGYKYSQRLQMTNISFLNDVGKSLSCYCGSRRYRLRINVVMFAKFKSHFHYIRLKFQKWKKKTQPLIINPLGEKQFIKIFQLKAQSFSILICGGWIESLNPPQLLKVTPYNFLVCGKGNTSGLNWLIEGKKSALGELKPQ